MVPFGRFAHFPLIRNRICKYSLVLSDTIVFYSLFILWRQWQKKSFLSVHNEGNETGLIYQLHLQNFDWFVLFSILFIGFAFFSGHYSRRRAFWDDAKSVSRGLLVFALLDMVGQALSGGSATLGQCFAQWMVLGIAIPCGRLLTKYVLRKLRIWQIPTAILGSGENAVQAYYTLGQEAILGYEVRCFVNLSAQHPIDPDLPEHVPVLRLDLDPACSSEVTIDPDAAPFFGHHIVIASDEVNDVMAFRIMDILSAEGHQIDVAPPLRGLPLLEMEVSHVFGREAVILHTKNSLARPARRWVKRGVDFCIALTAFTLSSPLLLYLAYRVRKEDGGPAFFYQERIGFGGKPFQCIKFRSMKIDAEAALIAWKENNPDLWEEYRSNSFKIRNDPRVTRIGRFIRSTSLDEHPFVHSEKYFPL